MSENDTIAAISTPLGEGGIGIVRLSGPQAFSIVERILDCSKKSSPDFPRPRYLYYGHIKDFRGAVIDEVLVAFMPAPHTYTREDIVEINCHSGIFTLRAVHRLVLAAGARTAEAGEFTKRAFINGRIDLSQAEAVLSMIRARSVEAVKVAARGLQGELMDRIEAAREQIITLRAPLEASFDYPEEFDEDEFDYRTLEKKLATLKADLHEMLKGAEKNRAYQEGVSVAIIGKPNVGKSSLLNALLQQQRAIVHEIPGTTRDLLEGYLNLGGYPIRLVDTAGIQGTSDPVEKQGIDLSRSAAGLARLIILVFDGSAGWTEADEEIAGIRRLEQGLVVVINKRDLEPKLKPELISSRFPEISIVETSAVQGRGIKELEEAVTAELDRIFNTETVSESPVVVSIRHEEILEQARQHLDHALKAVKEQPLEIVSLELQNAWSKLGEITGDTINENLLDKIFSEFCLGK